MPVRQPAGISHNLLTPGEVTYSVATDRTVSHVKGFGTTPGVVTRSVATKISQNLLTPGMVTYSVATDRTVSHVKGFGTTPGVVTRSVATGISHHNQPLLGYLERTVGYTARAQHPVTGGWRYQPGDDGDTSQLGWQLMSLHGAQLGGLPTPAATRAGMIHFLNSVTTGPQRGLVSYRPRTSPSRTMTAEALVCRMFLGVKQEEAAIREAVAYLLQETPQGGPFNEYYWYYATLALFQLQGDAWEAWNGALQERLLTSQETSGTLAGSWPTNTVWGGYGGRVYATAMNALCLEIYYRHLPLYASAR